jgi:hypothetical protein
MRRISVTVVLTLTVAMSTIAAKAQVPRGFGHIQKDAMEPLDRHPDGKGRGERGDRGPRRMMTTTGTSNAIAYHGGPIMLGTTHIYYIWYGNWAGDSAQSILLDLASNLNGSPYHRINTTYYNGAGLHVSKWVTYKGSTSDHYSKGVNIGDASVQAVVSSAITSGRLPKDPAGVYFVLTSKDVKETSGFCTAYCGWHTHATIAGTDIKFAFIGDPAMQCPGACEQQTTRSPNANPGADGMASVIAHELSEAVTDPALNAWYDANGEENADKCAWTFGTTYAASNGSRYNITLGSRQYLLQRNWVNSGAGYCAMSY